MPSIPMICILGIFYRILYCEKTITPMPNIIPSKYMLGINHFFDSSPFKVAATRVKKLRFQSTHFLSSFNNSIILANSAE